MGRELKRVPLDFNWQLGVVWRGFINPHHVATECPKCDGSGMSAEAKRLSDLWYGYVPFKPESRGSTPFLPSDEHIRSFAERNIQNDNGYYRERGITVDMEAQRLADLFNSQWSHHLNDDDVAALIAANRLYDFTHTFTPGVGWEPKEPPYIPTAREVNIWSCRGIAHDAINQWVVAKAECKRLGQPTECSFCGGEGELWPSADAKKVYEDWTPEEPPEGTAYQIWETVSEGSPISPPFATPEELASHMEQTRWGADDGTSYEAWLKFITGLGWAPSLVSDQHGVRDGITAVTE